MCAVNPQLVQLYVYGISDIPLPSTVSRSAWIAFWVLIRKGGRHLIRTHGSPTAAGVRRVKFVLAQDIPQSLNFICQFSVQRIAIAPLACIACPYDHVEGIGCAGGDGLLDCVRDGSCLFPRLHRSTYRELSVCGCILPAPR